MSAKLPLHLRNQIRALDKGVCAYCRSPEYLSVTAFEVDHVVPVSAGGATVLDNLCLACTTCNRNKGTHQDAFDPVSGVLVALFHPRRQNWSEHFEWNPERTEIEGLTPVGRATVGVLQMNRPQLVRLRGLWRRLGYQLEG